MYKSNKEINEEFYSKIVEFSQDVGNPVEAYAMQRIADHIAQIRQNDLKGLVEWAESKKKDVLFCSKNVARGRSGYNHALTDFITKVESLNRDTK